MLSALVIAAKDLRQRLRDRSAIVLTVVAPVVVAALMSAAFSGVEHLHETLAVADEDHGAVAASLLAALRSPQVAPLVTVREEPSASAVSAAVRSGSAGAGLVIPAGFSASVAGAAPKALTTVASVNNALAAQLARSVVDGFTAQVNADRLAVATALAAGAPPERLAALADAASRLRLPVGTVQRAFGAHELKPISYFAPAMALFFMLFIVSFTSRSFFVDREEGMIERILAAPVSAWEVVAGKALSALVLAAVSVTVMLVVTEAAFGADWGDPLAAVLVALSMVLAVVALTALVIVLARSQRQAEMISSIVIFGLALLGGNFVYVAVEPDVMRTLALLTPNGWALRAFTDLATTGGGLGVAVVPILAILAFTAVVGTAAALLARRVVVR